MQNHMRETIDQGLGVLRSSAGKNGLPAIPVRQPGCLRWMRPSPPIAPPPDPNAASDIALQVRVKPIMRNGMLPVPGATGSRPTQPRQRVGGDQGSGYGRGLGRATEGVELGNNTMVYTFEPPSVPYRVKIFFNKEGKVIDVQ